MNAKRGSSVASSLDHLFVAKVIKITDISSPTRHFFIQTLPPSTSRRHWSGASMIGARLLRGKLHLHRISFVTDKCEDELTRRQVDSILLQVEVGRGITRSEFGI